MRTINLTKIVTMLLITMLICSMMFEMTYANTLLVESRTVGNMELELEKHITKNKPAIEHIQHLLHDFQRSKTSMLVHDHFVFLQYFQQKNSFSHESHFVSTISICVHQ